MRTRAFLFACLLGATLVPACAASPNHTAGNPPPPNTAQRTNKRSDEPKGEALAPGYATAPNAAPPGYPSPTFGPRPAAPSTATFPADLPGADPMFGLILAEQGVAMSLSSCDVACKALGSMERAVQQICVSDRGTDGERCSDAKGRLRRARARVREACSICPEGPTTDPDAPI